MGATQIASEVYKFRCRVLEYDPFSGGDAEENKNDKDDKVRVSFEGSN